MCIPISALVGDNVVTRSQSYAVVSGTDASRTSGGACPRGPAATRKKPARFPVQYVIRPDASFRGFAGQVAGGAIRKGDTLLALPSGQKTKVRSIVTYDGEPPEAFAPDVGNAGAGKRD